MRRSGKFLLLSLFALCSLRPPCYSEDAPQAEPSLTEMSSNIRRKLLDLKTSSEIVTAQLQTLSESLTQSQEEARMWEAESTRLSASLTSINDELNNSFATITRYEERLKTRAKVIAMLAVIILIRLLGVVAGFVLMAKRVPVPRWVDILL